LLVVGFGSLVLVRRIFVVTFGLVFTNSFRHLLIVSLLINGE
jgi:hypothetical protein